MKMDRFTVGLLWVITYLLFGYFGFNELFHPPNPYDMKSGGFYVFAWVAAVIWLPIYYFAFLTILSRLQLTKISEYVLYSAIAIFPIFFYSLAFGYAGPWSNKMLERGALFVGTALAYNATWTVLLAFSALNRPSAIYRLAVVVAIYGAQLPAIVLRGWP